MFFRDVQIEADEISFECFNPPFISPSPLLFEPSDNELEWIHHDLYNHAVTWDYSMCIASSQELVVRGLMARAFQGPLMPPQTKVCKKKTKNQKKKTKNQKKPKLIFFFRLC